MIEIDNSWLASSAGVLFLTEISVQMLKNLLKQSGDIYVNIATISLAALYSIVASTYLDRLTISQIYPLLGQIVIVSGVATLGYEVIKNLIPKN